MDKGLLVLFAIITIFVIALWQGQEASIRNQENIKERCIIYGFYNTDKIPALKSMAEELDKNINILKKEIAILKKECQ